MMDCPKIELGQITTTINGLWTGKKPPFVNVAVIRNTNFSKDCRLKMDDVAMIDVEVKQFASRKLQMGDIIIEKSGGSDKQPVGRPVLFNIPEGDYSFSNFTSTLRVIDQGILLPEYLHKFLYKFYLTGKTAEMQSKTTGLRNLDFNAYKAIKVPVPSIEEQQHIVDELNLLTNIIDKKNAQLRDLDALAQSIFHDMFGGNTSSWPSHRLGDICDTTSGGTPSKSHSEYYLNGTIPWLRSGEVEGTNITDTEIKITDLGVKYSSAKWFPAQTVVVAMYGATVGEVGILGKPMTTNQAVCGILPNGSLRPLYLYSWFRSKKMDFVEQATGGAQPNISQNIIRNSKICCPPLEIQDSFVERLASIEEQKLMVEKSTRDTQSLLDCRMDLYFG